MDTRSIIHVLLVEDSPTDVLLTHDALSAKRFKLQSCERLGEALNLLDAGGFDVVLLDLGLPDCQGLDTLRTLRGQDEQIPVVVLTGKNDEELATSALHEGAQDYLVKGQVDHDVLGRAIRYAIERNDFRTELREASEFNRQIIASAQEGIIVLDRELHYRVWNAYMETLSGLKSVEVVGKQPWEVIPFFDESASRLHLQPALEGKVVALPDLFMPANPPGRPAWVSQQISPFRDSAGRIAGVICTVRDITIRKHAETVLLERSRLASHSAEVSLAFTGGGTLREKLQRCVESMVHNLDAAFARIWTLNTKENVLELQASAGIYTHLDGPHSRIPMGMYKIGQIAQNRQPHLTNDVAHDSLIGDPAWAKREEMKAFAGYPLVLEDRLVGVVAMFARQILSETTLEAMAAVANQIALGIERNVKEEALRETQDRLQHLVASSPAIVYSLKLEGENVVGVWVSDRVKTMLNYNPRDVSSSQWWFDSIHPDDLEAASTYIRDLINQGHLVCEYRIRHHDGGYRWIHDEKSLIRDKNGLPVECVGSWTDITERKRTERYVLAQHAVTRVLADAASLSEASSPLLQVLCESLEWELGELWRVDPAAKELCCIQTWHRPTERYDEFAESNRQFVFSRGVGLPGRVWANRQPTWIPDVADDDNFLRKANAIRHGLRGAFGFPITLENEVLGVLEFFSQDSRQPDEGILQMMTAVGSQIGQFIERKMKVAALRESEERFQELTAHIHQVLWMIDAKEGNVVYVSPAYEVMWGRTCQSLLDNPRSYMEGIHPLDMERMVRETAVMFQTGHIDIETRILRPDGTSRWVWVRGYPVLEKDQVIRIVGVVEDITEKRHLAAERDTLLARLQLHIERMPLAYVLYDGDLHIADWNPAAERIFGYAKAEALGKEPFDFVPPSFRQRGEELLNRIRGGDMVAHSVNENVTKDGGIITCEWFNTPIMAEDGRFGGLLCLAQDVSEKKSLEQQLQQSQKMEAFGQLAGGVAHDFNNLLTIIMGYSEMLMTMMPNDAKRNMLSSIHHAGERAVGLTRQLLAFSRKQVLEPKICDLNEIVSNIEKMIRRLIGEDVIMACILAPNTSRVLVDVGQIEQVVMNLAVNARDAMPQGGRLTIETRNVEWDEGYCRLHPEFKPGHYVMLAVTDTGTGMTPEVKARIFEPFFTTKGLGKGTGLGLATVFGIIKQSEGQICVYSEVGVGTCFKIFLPAAEVRKVAQAANHATGSPTPGSETILIVEDENGVRNITQFILESHGYKVLAASSGPEALTIIQSHPERIHLVITDVVMPEMSGRELTAILRKRCPDCRVLYVSGYTDDAIVRHGIIQADVAFLQKPFTPVALARKVREVLDDKK